jgi:hypothetical protein
MNEKATQMVLPPPAQVGVVVRNLSQAIAYYSETSGLGPFQNVLFIPAQHWVRENIVPLSSISGCAHGDRYSLS